MRSTIIVLIAIGVFVFFSTAVYATGDTTIKGTTSDTTKASLEVTNSSNASLLYVRNDGNVGVGTTSPNTKLEVNGAISGFGVVPIGSIIAWHKSLTGTPALPLGWVECNGQVLSDPESVYNGQTIPNLNGEGRFLRGGSTSGVNQAATTVKTKDGYGDIGYPLANNVDGWVVPDGTSTWQATITSVASYNLRGAKVRPVNMSVVWIMRVK